MSFGPEFSTQDQPPTAPVSASTTDYVGIAVALMFLLGIILIVSRLRARTRKFARMNGRGSPKVNLQRGSVTTLPAGKPEEVRRQSA